MTVIEGEEPGNLGYEFKVNFFKNAEYAESMENSLVVFGSDAFDQEIMSFLMDYDAESPQPQFHKQGE